MFSIGISLTVFFDGQYWVGIVERQAQREYQAAKLVFGAEPSDAEVLEVLKDCWCNLHFTYPQQTAGTPAVSKNPKRRQREAARVLKQRGASTKSQLAFVKERETRKTVRAQQQTVKKKEEDTERFKRKQEKRKAKHRGH